MTRSELTHDQTNPSATERASPACPWRAAMGMRELVIGRLPRGVYGLLGETSTRDGGGSP